MKVERFSRSEARIIFKEKGRFEIRLNEFCGNKAVR